MDGRRRESIAAELRVWRETRDARRNELEELIISAEQAISYAHAAVERARWIRTVFMSGDGKGPGRPAGARHR
jgi:hypothetical protein